MKNLKKLAASLAAFTTALSLSVGTLAVTANEIQKAIDAKPAYTKAENKFVTSFNNNAKYTEISKYLIDSGASLEDAELIMDMYISADKETSAKKNWINVKGANSAGNDAPQPFYNKNNLSKNQHYGVIISNSGTVHKYGINFDLTYYENNKISLKSTTAINNLYNGVCLNPRYYDSNHSNLEVVFSAMGNININLDPTKPAGICDFPFKVISRNLNEKSIRELLKFYVDPKNLTSNYRFETYVQGDCNHDGIVDAKDLQMLIDYNLGHQLDPISYVSMELNGINYTIDDNSAAIVNNLASDADRNGVLDIADVTWIAKNVDKPISKK